MRAVKAPWMAVLIAGAMLCGATAVLADDKEIDNDEAEKVADAKVVFEELMTSEDHGVPKELLEHATAIAVIPGVYKAAMGVGGRHGSGIMTTRRGDGWSPPTFVTISGGSFGFQIGVEKTDLVLFFMSEKSARAVTSSKFTLGAQAGVAAGPVGRSGEASTDIKLNAEIYSYAKSKGLFAGVSLEGARLAPDEKDNKKFYGKSASAKDLLFGDAKISMPTEAQSFISVLP